MDLLGQVRDLLAQQRVSAYLVGGYVRDALFGRNSFDIDLAVESDPAQLAGVIARRLQGAAVTLDEEDRVVRVVVPHEGRQWNVDLTALEGGDIHHDLLRRDFTVDALGVPLEATAGPSADWPVLDPGRGREDLRLGLVRAVGPAVFQDDPARLLRAVRLAAQLDFQIEESTQQLVQRHAGLVATVSAERVRDELLKTLACPGVRRHLALLDELGLLCTVLPELAVGKGVVQPKEHYWDVFQHNLETAGQAERLLIAHEREGDPALAAVPWELWMDGYFQDVVSDGHSRATLLKLAGLLHDVAKPATKTVEPDGRVRFLGHNTQGAAMVEAALRRLRLSGRGVEMLTVMVEHHLHPSHLAQKGQLPTNRAIYRYFRDLGPVAVDTLYLAMADFLAARGPTLPLLEWKDYCSMIGYVLRTGLGPAAPAAVPKLVDGHALVEVFGLTPGPLFRELLEAVREAQAAGEISTREEALKLVARLLDKGLASEAGPSQTPPS
ncbi:MAG: HD domain-containing protein [Chloroflexi bacterium]|nr:HD domain-containing protein [Chloroflexota bacterium]